LQTGCTFHKNQYEFNNSDSSVISRVLFNKNKCHTITVLWIDRLGTFSVSCLTLYSNRLPNNVIYVRINKHNMYHNLSLMCMNNVIKDNH